MNVFEVRTTHQAEDQMREIAWHIAVELHNPGAAEDLLDEFEREFLKLSMNPARHPRVDEEPWKTEEIRWVKIRHYLVYFWIDTENAAVQITGVVYERRDQKNFLGKMKMSD